LTTKSYEVLKREMEEKKEEIFTLFHLKEDEVAQVIKLPSDSLTVKKLHSMGIRKGCIVQKISHQIMGGPLIIKIGKTQIGIGSNLAKKLVVQVIKKN
jgi:Fe2+ transport system protein FeoA